MCKDDYPPILEELRKEKFDTLLDAGCGTAPMQSLLTKEYRDKHFVGLELSNMTSEELGIEKKANYEFPSDDELDSIMEE